MYGLTAFHKSIVNGHREMAEHLMEKTDRACFNVPDRHGRNALFYGAALSEFDDIGMYGWLMNMGYDKNHEDNVSWTEKQPKWLGLSVNLLAFGGSFLHGYVLLSLYYV